VELYDELLELVLAYSNRQIKFLAQWIIDYRKKDKGKELDLRLEKTLYLNRFRRMAGEYAALKPKERAAMGQDLFEFYSAHLMPLIPNGRRFEIDELCYTGKWPEAAARLAELDVEIEAAKSEKEYERLVTDTEYLIEQLVTIMKDEYARRLDSMKEAMGAFMEPHRTAFERLERNLAEARDGLVKVGRSGLSPADKEEISARFRERMAEIGRMEARERENVRKIRDFADEVRKIYLVFEGVIASIEREKDLIEERRGYAGLLERLEIETREMDEVFKGLGLELGNSLQKTRESMELLTAAFQGRLVDVIGEAIDDQEKVNSLLGESDGRGGEGGEGAEKHDYYEDILKILKSAGD
jgi:hypothetical protein